MKFTPKLTIPIATALVLLLTLTIASFILFDRESITILNANPYPCVVAVKYQSAPGTWETVGWFPLGPGERKTISAIFFRVKAVFYVTAESRDPGLLSWLIEDGKGVIYFVGDDLSGQLPKDREVNLVEVEDQNPELEEIKFREVKTHDEIFLLTDPLFHDAVLRNEGAESDEEAGYELIREKARSLYESLQRQKRFEETFKVDSDYPFRFEFDMTDDAESGFMYLGVTITDVMSHTLHGDEVQLKAGDILLGVGSGDKPVTPVFAPADSYVTLHEHAVDTENGGISNPLTFIVLRNGEVLQIQSYYIFNPNFNWDDVSAVRAFFEGGADYLTFGLWPSIVGFFNSDAAADWKTTQRLCRLKQFHPNATVAGHVATVVVPLPTRFIRIGRAGWLARTFSSPVVQGISVELLRAVVYSYKTKVPSPEAKPTANEYLTKLFASANPPDIFEGLSAGGVEPSFKNRQPKFGVTH